MKFNFLWAGIITAGVVVFSGAFFSSMNFWNALIRSHIGYSPWGYVITMFPILVLLFITAGFLMHEEEEDNK